MTPVDEIKARIDIVDLVSESVQLRKAGKNYTGFCPFHPNSRTPAFVVFPDTGTWRCFGQCSEGGDIFKFVMKKEGCDFSEALRQLAERAGVQLRQPSNEEIAEEQENENLRSILEDAVNYYRHLLLNSKAGAQALAYLKEKRGLDEQTIERFGLGFAPESWDSTANHFRSKSYSAEQLLACGLVSERDSGEVYDRFRNRLMIPIRDIRGRMTGFGARILNPDDVPKFLNSPQTALFDKSNLLYGLDAARKAIREKDQTVIVEGYFDVITLHQYGFSNVVSPMGTALTEQQLRQLNRYSKRMVLALDADAAGNQATLRGLQVARSALEHESDLVFDARGLIRQEVRLNADVRVSTLPEGVDPDEIVIQNPDDWQEIIDGAKPVVIHVMEMLSADRDLDDPKEKSDIATQVLPLIQDIPDPIQRDTYQQRLARLLQVNEKALLEFSPARSRRRKRPAKTEPGTEPETKSSKFSAPESTNNLEIHCLGLMLRSPEFLFLVDRQLQEFGLARLSKKDFQHVDHQELFGVFQESVNQDISEPKEFLMNSLTVPMMELANQLLERTSGLEMEQNRLLEDLMRGLLEIRKRTVIQNIEYQRITMEISQGGDQESVPGKMKLMVQLSDTKRRIDLALGKYTSRSITSPNRSARL